MNNGTPGQPESETDFKYWAFISYSHQDNLAVRGDGSGDHIQWANWLHEQLETFRVPDGYRDRITPTGEPMPERFFPAFRDEAELPTSHDLGGQIHDALRRSRFLIVIASPRSAASRYVNEEGCYFRQLGRGNRILTHIVDGEPNVRLHPKAGWKAADDCFCPALVHTLKEDGSVDEAALLPEEPIAADVRVKDAEPPREMRASERAQSDRQGLLDFMKLKLIAGLMGVGLDELVQRDKRRAEEQLKRSRQELSRTEFLFARQLLDLKDYRKAYARLSKALENDPQNRAASVLGLEEIRRRANRGALRCHFHEGAVVSAEFSPDGSRILTASWDTTARLWDATTGQPLAEPMRHEGGVLSAVFSPDGARILTASDDNTARLWDTATSQPLAEPMRHEDWVVSAVFSPDGAQILTASHDKTAQLWETATGRPLAAPLRHEHSVKSAVFSLDGARILTASHDKTARLWDAATGQPLAEPLRHENWVTSAVFSSDSARILTASWDGTARLWDAATGRPLAEPLRHENWVTSAVFSSDSARILTTVLDDNTARLWDAATGQMLTEPMRHENRVNSAVFSPDGSRILTASADNTARLWDAATGQMLTEPMRHENRVNSAVFSPDGSRILTASADNTARLWDAASGRPLAEPMRHEDWVVSAVFSPDGTRILTASDDRTARLWDAALGRPLAEPLRHVFPVRSAVFSPDGTQILTVTNDRTARLWDAASGRPLIEPLRHESTAQSFVFSPDGARILTASYDKTSRLWDTATGQQLAEPMRHEAEICSAVFSPDGARILTASYDNTARLWDTATGHLKTADALRLSCLLEIAWGYRLDGIGLLEPMPPADIERLRHDFLSTSELDRLLLWWWSDPFTRIIHPSSTITVPAFVRRRIGEVLDWPDDKVKASALREACDAFPHHPLVLIAQAEAGKHGDPAWLAQHAVSRLLAEPHYLTPLQSRMTDADRAARAYELKDGLAEDCFLGARLLQRQNRTDLARKVIARACKLVPENETFLKLAVELGH